MSETEIMNIALGFDKKFLPHAATTIKSIIVNNQNSCINFILMTNNSINKIDKFLLKNLIGKHHSVKFINMQENFKNLFEGAWSTAMYYPILLSQLCNDSKVLFLDADIVVNGCLSNFYETDLQDYYCAAVRDFGISILAEKSNLKSKINNNQRMTIGDYLHNNLNFSKLDIDNYFNSGTLLLNLEKIRDDKLDSQMIEFINNNDLMFPDQDCFNVFFKGKTKLMPYTYNFQIIHKNTIDSFNDEEKLNYEKYLENYKNPIIIHYLDKPFKNTNKVLFGDLYYFYRNKTFWRFTLDKRIRKKIIQMRISRYENYLYLFNHKIYDINKKDKL